MPVPAEYQRATEDFYAFLVDVRDTSGLWSTHVTYTMTQAVFQTFRRRLTLEQSIRFANVLPACLRALYIADWDLDEPRKQFATRQEMTAEVKALRPNHNFSTDDAIREVATALRRHVDQIAFDKVLASLPSEARDFWQEMDGT